MNAKPDRPHRESHPRQAAMLALVLATAFTGAHAHVFCVTGGDAAQLQNALTQSSDGGVYAGEDNFIRVAQGMYQTGAATGNVPFFYYSTTTRLLQILGSYNADCTTQQRKALLTKLDGNDSTGVLIVRSANGPVDIEDLTIQNGNSDEPGAGLQVNYLVSVNASVNVGDLIVRSNHSSVDAGGLYVSGAGTQVYVSNNLIVGNSAQGQHGAGYVIAYGQYNELYNNTVVQNVSTAVTNPVGGLYCAGTAPCYLYNNIFWNNTTYGLDLGNSGALLSHNDVGTLGGETPAVTDHELSTTPKFVDAANGDFRLAADSPLLGYGPPQGSTVDLLGNPYPTTGKIDLGAYAETIFTDGFDGG